jgi:hypothetical protein
MARQQYNFPARQIPAATGSQIYVYHAGTSVQIANTIYADSSSGTTLSNPYTHPGGNIVFYLAQNVAVDIGVKPSGAASPAVSAVGPAASTTVANYGLHKIGSMVSGWFRF